MKRLPVGMETFVNIRQEGYLYIDKTDMIWELPRKGKHLFFSRPRRFGKSLMLSTLASYFRAEKELFRGLKLEALQRESGEEWVERPVIHLNFSGGGNRSVEQIEELVAKRLDTVEKRYGIEPAYSGGMRFANLIEELHRKTGRNVVILVDEYDAPLLELMGREGKEQVLEDAKSILREMYMNLKVYDGLIHFSMITGVSQFSQLSLFSGMNSIQNISLQEKWATLCGITEGELLDSFPNHLAALGDHLHFTPEQTLAALKHKYDGYRFTPNGTHVYCPFGLLLALENQLLDNYWAKTGTPKVLEQILPHYYIQPKELLAGVELDIADIASVEAMRGAPIPFLYQTGYLTIKRAIDDETLEVAFPNGEVRVALARLMRQELFTQWAKPQFEALRSMKRLLNEGDLPGFMGYLEPLLSGVPYISDPQDIPAREATFRNAMYVILTLLEESIHVERPSALGRSDCEIDALGAIYIFELKLKSSGESARKALLQIRDKRYGDKYLHAGKPIICVGAVFDRAAKADWVEMPYAEVLELEGEA